jgi:hypothetical protein
LPRALAAPAATLFAVLVALSACGAPEPPNIRQEFGNGIQRLGVTPIYPLSESTRIGQVFLVDESAKGAGDVAAYIPTSVLLTNAVVPEMEERRAALTAAANRFPCSADALGEQVSPDHSYYRQATCAAAPTPETTPDKKDVPPLQPAGSEGLAPLALAGLPSYSLASIDNLSLAGTVPTKFANFLAAIGWRETTSLRVEAEGVEIAKLPTDDFVAALNATCNRPDSVFNNPRLARSSLELAIDELKGHAIKRREEAAKQGIELPEKPVLRLYILREVYYLRGIRYIANNSKAYAMLVEAAARSGVKDAARPPTVPTIAMNVIQPTPTGSQGAPPATSADVAALQQQIDALRTAVSSNANIQVGGTFARATARGIEFVELFQRPLAFGYVALISKNEPDMERSYQDFCYFAKP